MLGLLPQVLPFVPAPALMNLPLQIKKGGVTDQLPFAQSLARFKLEDLQR